MCSMARANGNVLNALHRVRFYGQILPEYYQIVLEAYKGIGLINAVSKGMTIKHFTQTSLYSLFFPLPPIEEQKRLIAIVSLLSKRFCYVTSIATNQ